MAFDIDNLLTLDQLHMLSNIVQIGESCYRDMIKDHSLLDHFYCDDLRRRARTKFVQLQYELESHDPAFPFELVQRSFQFDQKIPELHTERLILHIGRSTSPEKLPNRAKYKTDLSDRNSLIARQRMLNFYAQPVVKDTPFYGILTFGGNDKTFANVLFPSPGYKEIADRIPVPLIVVDSSSNAGQSFERKKAVLKDEFNARHAEGVN